MNYLNIQMNDLNIQMNDLNIQMPLFVIYKIIMSRLECSLKINRFKKGRAAALKFATRIDLSNCFPFPGEIHHNRLQLICCAFDEFSFSDSDFFFRFEFLVTT